MKIKEVLYGEVPPGIRLECHEKIADTIQSQNMDSLEEIAGDLAFHYYRCRNQKKALPHLIMATEMAKEQYENEEAIRFYTGVLELEEDRKRRRGSSKILIGVFGMNVEPWIDGVS